MADLTYDPSDTIHISDEIFSEDGVPLNNTFDTTDSLTTNFLDHTVDDTVDITDQIDAIGTYYLTLRPNAPGYSAQNVPVGAATNWDCVDEIVADDDTTYVWMKDGGGYDIDLHNCPNHTTDSGLISKVTVHVVTRTTSIYSGFAWKLKGTIRIGGANYYSNWTDVTTSYVDYSFEWSTNPAGGNWTWDNIDDIQIGFLQQSGSPDCEIRTTQVYMVVESQDAFQQTASDTFDISDSVDNYLTIVLNDTVDIDDGQYIQDHKSINNTLDISDCQYIHDELFLDELLDIDDNLSIHEFYSIPESVNITDGITDAWSWLPSDTFDITDIVDNYLTIVVSDTLDITDELYSLDEIFINNTLDITDSLSNLDEIFVNNTLDMADELYSLDEIFVNNTLDMADELFIEDHVFNYDDFDILDSYSALLEICYSTSSQFDISDIYTSHKYKYDLDIYYLMDTDPNGVHINCWCCGWNRNDYELTIETTFNKENRDLLLANIYPGSVKELFDVLGEKYFVDSTWQDKNTLKLSPIAYHPYSDIGLMHDETTIAVKTISYEPINRWNWRIKIVGIILSGGG